MNDGWVELYLRQRRRLSRCIPGDGRDGGRARDALGLSQRKEGKRLGGPVSNVDSRRDANPVVVATLHQPCRTWDGPS